MAPPLCAPPSARAAPDRTAVTRKPTWYRQAERGIEEQRYARDMSDIRHPVIDDA
jgi:hypothetical protein